MSNSINFTRQLVKGRIAETIFSQMLRASGNYTVLEFGYEKIIPELVQNGFDEHRNVVETLRTAPDFAIIDRRRKHVHLVEVKYRRVINNESILQIAQRMKKTWSPSYLFLATPEGFYFDEISTIIQNHGEILGLDEHIAPPEVQVEYLKILNDFEQNQ